MEDPPEQSGIIRTFTTYAAEKWIICSFSTAFRLDFPLRPVALHALAVAGGISSFCVALQLFIRTPTSASCFY